MPAATRTATGAPTAASRPTARRRRPPGHRIGRWVAWAFQLPLVAYLLTFFAYPLYRNLDLSLRDYTVRSFVQGGAPFTGLANYRRIVDDPTFVPALTHTV